MSDKQERSSVGELMKEALQKAVETGDFKQLNDIVANTVNSALSETKEQVRQVTEDVVGASKKASENAFQSSKAGVDQAKDFIRNVQIKDSFNQPNREKKVNNSPTIIKANVKTKKVGSVSGTLFIVFGSIGLGVMCLLLLTQLIFLSFIPFGKMAGYMGLVSLLIIIFSFMIERGRVRKRRLKRAERYIELGHGKMYVDIEDLAMQTHKSKNYIIKDIKKMIQKEIFPEGHLDEKQTCFMMDDDTYREYLKVRKERKMMDAELKAEKKMTKKEPVVNAEEPADEKEMSPELKALMTEGQDYIRNLRDMNDNIKGEVISAKLFQLEHLLKQIFDRVKEQPNQLPQMQKFMDYYLPTTIKLVQAYAEFDQVSVPGEDIKTAQMEIEKTLDTINHAFTELLNNLYRDAVFDATTDAQVLQSMLSREGLTKEMTMEMELQPTPK